MGHPIVEYFEMLNRTFLNFRSGFSTRQSFGKAIKKAKRTLPKDFNRRKKVIQVLAQAVGVVPQNNHQRTTRQLSSNMKSHIISFYCSDDISYQMRGKHDTIVVNHDGNAITY